MAQRILGIDLGSYLVKVAVMEVGFRQTTLKRVVSVPVVREDVLGGEAVLGAEDPPALATSVDSVSDGQENEDGEGAGEVSTEALRDGEAILAALRRALEKVGDRPDVTALGLPGDMATLRGLEFPFNDARKVAAVLSYELEGQIPYDLDEVVFDHQLTPTGRGEGRVLVSIAQVRRTALFLDLVAKAGLDPQILTAAPLAYGYLGLPGASDSPPMAVLDIGHSRTNLVVLSGTSTVFGRTLSRGGGNITRALAARYQVSEARAAEIKHGFARVSLPGDGPIPSDQRPVVEVVDAEILPLVRALRQSLLTLRKQPALCPQSMLLCGGTSSIRGLTELLARELEIPVTTSLPSGAPTGTGARGQVLALGLAQGAADRRLPVCNLRTGPLAVREERSLFRKRALYFSASAALVLGLLVVNGFFSLWTLQKEEQKLRAELAQKTLEVFNKPINDPELVSQRINAALRGRRVSSLPIPDASAFALLSELSRKLPGKTEVTLDVTRLHIREGKIDFEATVKDAEEVDKLVEALKKIKCFSKVSQGRISEVTVREMVEGEMKTDKRRKFNVDIAHNCI